MLGNIVLPFSFPYSMCHKHNMFGFGVGGCTARIDDSPPSLSSFEMLEEHDLDDAIKVKRIIK